MTYHLTSTTRPRASSRRSALGGLPWGDALLALQHDAENQQQLDCLNQANQQTAGLDAKIQQIGKSWTSTGIYTPDDLRSAINEILPLLANAADAVRASPNATRDAEMAKDSALDDTNTQFQRGQVYIAALGKALTEGVPNVSAPGFKEWVMRSMTAASNALTVAGVMRCNMTWLATGVMTYMVWFTRIQNVVVRIGKVVIKVGAAVLDAGETTADILLFAGKYLPFVAIAGAGYLIYRKYGHGGLAR